MGRARPRCNRSLAAWPASSAQTRSAPNTVAARSIPKLEQFEQVWTERASLGWAITNPTPVAHTVLLLLSQWSRAITGEILHVDGGYHAIGA